MSFYAAILLIIFAIISFFFAVSETAVIGLSKIRLRHMLAKGVRRAHHVQHLVANLDKFIVAILVGNNFVNITISAIATGVFVKIFGYNWGVLISTFVTTMLILIFCEITPKILAIKHTEKLALFTAPIMTVFIKTFSTVIGFFSAISNFILKIFRMQPVKHSALITEEELRLMIEIGKEEGVVSDQERRLLHRVFEFGDTKVSDVMIPLDKVAMVNLSSTPEELLNIFVEEGHARLPVYKGTRENIVGVVFARDLLYILRDKGLFVVPDLLHEPYTISTSARVSDLLGKFQAEKIQIAIIVDEHKKALGLVTLEDLIEEIVGEIEERHVHNHRK